MKYIFSDKSASEPIVLSSEADKKMVQPRIDPPESHGQLPIDILENDYEILLITPIAGVNLEETEIIINNDILTIRGKREAPAEAFGFKKKDYYSEECFWGEFSRSVILPANADVNGIEAKQKNHVLTIRIPKLPNIQMRIVKIKS